jgi:hypothetical protein
LCRRVLDGSRDGCGARCRNGARRLRCRHRRRRWWWRRRRRDRTLRERQQASVFRRVVRCGGKIGCAVLARASHGRRRWRRSALRRPNELGLHRRLRVRSRALRFHDARGPLHGVRSIGAPLASRGGASWALTHGLPLLHALAPSERAAREPHAMQRDELVRTELEMDVPVRSLFSGRVGLLVLGFGRLGVAHAQAMRSRRLPHRAAPRIHPISGSASSLCDHVVLRRPGPLLGLFRPAGKTQDCGNSCDVSRRCRRRFRSAHSGASRSVVAARIAAYSGCSCAVVAGA